MSATNDNNDVLYLHITPSGKKYFGVTSQKPKRRWSNGKGYSDNKYFTKAINKYGWDNIQHIILADGLTSFEADLFEIFCIAYYDTMNHNIGYNQDCGGRGKNHRPSEETKRKISESAKGKHKGQNSVWYGKHFSEEHKQKLSRSNPNSKTVICITTGKCYRSTKEIERITGIAQCSISKVCNGNRNYAGKLSDGTPLKWKYVQDLPKPQVSEEIKQLLRNGPKLLKSV